MTLATYFDLLARTACSALSDCFVRCRAGALSRCSGSVANRSAPHPTRLETRTKESNMCASHWVLRNPKAQWKWRLALVSLRCDPVSWPRRNTGPSRGFVLRRSKSVHVGTRKMVNYAWVGWSQRKLWWRTVAILTCKSIVELGYRGERLIEPSSSWFPPKFPSG